MQGMKYKLAELAQYAAWTYTRRQACLYSVCTNPSTRTNPPSSLPVKLCNLCSVPQFSSLLKIKALRYLGCIILGGENETEQPVQKSTPASPLAGRKEWAALRSCNSVVCHESQSADVCSVRQPNLHTPTINLLPGNPLPLTCLCVRVWCSLLLWVVEKA